MEPGGEWICCSCPADALLISVLHYKHPIWHSHFTSILSLWVSFDAERFVSLCVGPVYKQTLEQSCRRAETHARPHTN